MIWREGMHRRCAAIGRKRRDLSDVLYSLCLLLGLAISAESAKGSSIDAVNHTPMSISRFSVDGRSGLDVVGPYQGGGGGCCYTVPTEWKYGLSAQIDWETSPSAASELADEFPGFADEVKLDKWIAKLESQERKHTKTVPIPDYTNQKTCGITVHFLPCDELQVTTSCYAYGNPNYPIKTPLKLPEPQSCPQ